MTEPTDTDQMNRTDNLKTIPELAAAVLSQKIATIILCFYNYLDQIRVSLETSRSRFEQTYTALYEQRYRDAATHCAHATIHTNAALAMARYVQTAAASLKIATTVTAATSTKGAALILGKAFAPLGAILAIGYAAHIVSQWMAFYDAFEEAMSDDAELDDDSEQIEFDDEDDTDAADDA